MTSGPSSKLRVLSFSISVDGYGAGPGQDADHPLGVGGMRLHEWLLGTRTFKKMTGGEGGATGVDNDFAARGFDNIGAWILGRNMFGPIRDAWPDENWKGWWGDDPPYHVPVFVLTHHARPLLAMKGGTTFHFVTDGIHSALERARDAANGNDIRLGGGVATIRQYLREGWWTICISRSLRRCSVRASTSSPASTCQNSATSFRSTRLRQTRRMSF